MKRSGIALVTALFLTAPLYASHSWSSYHWARTTPSFNLIVVNSTTPDWDGFVTAAIGDWSQSTVVNLVQDETGDTSNRTRRQCRPDDGMVRICNLAYGFTGWLGIAGIYANADGHIVKGYTKLNDTYFSSSPYDDPLWRRSVTCQELGHNIGLDHQDEDFRNESLFTCMDYQNPPYAYPNNHDYEQIESMYGHLDSYDSYADSAPAPLDSGDGDGGGCNAPPGKGCNKGQNADGNSRSSVGWGMSVARRGQIERFERINPDGSRVITFVTWANGH